MRTDFIPFAHFFRVPIVCLLFAGAVLHAEPPRSAVVGKVLDPDHTPYLFDTNGNAGSTAWWDGRIVGTWVQDEAARVQTVLRGTLPRAARRALQHEANRLTEWFAGERVTSIYAARLAAGAKLR